MNCFESKKGQDSSNKNCLTKLAQSWQCVPKQSFSKHCMEEKLRFHARNQKCSLMSTKRLEVMTVKENMGRRKDVSTEIQSALA